MFETAPEPLPFVPLCPDTPASHKARGRLRLRYQDLTQDGRCTPLRMTDTVPMAWSKLLMQRSDILLSYNQGIIPILARLAICTHHQPVTVLKPLQTEATYQLSAVRDEETQAVERLLMSLWTEAIGVGGCHLGPRPPNEGQPTPAGWLFSQYVMTRPFAPPAERKVRQMADGSVPDAPGRWRPPAAAAALPEGAMPLEDEASSCAWTTTFCLDDTDPNQHVNSLVYPQLFQEAALRRLAARGHDMNIRSRAVDVAFRKPCFAGDTVRVHLQLFQTPGGDPGALGWFVKEPCPAPDQAPHRSSDPGKPCAYLRMLFGR